MAKGLVMTRYIQRGGSVWHDHQGWAVRYDARSIIDQFVIRNDGNLKEKISFTMEDADNFVDFIMECKKAYAKWLKYQEHPEKPFAEIENAET